MNKRASRKALVMCAILGCSLSLAAFALGQSGMWSNPYGSNIDTPTPQRLALDAQRDKMDAAAVQALHAGQYDQAITYARSAMSVETLDILGPKVLAQALEAKGDTQGAFQAYKALADRGSSHPEDLMPYALLLLHQGQWAGALAAYEKALPFVGEGNLLRANDDFSLDNPQPQALEAAIHVARGLTYNIGDIVTPHPRNDKALAEYQQAVASAPDSDLANYYYGCGLQRLGRRADAQAAFRKAAALDQGLSGVRAAAEDALAGR